MEIGAPSNEDVIHTPPMRAQQAADQDGQERPSVAISTQASSTPGRDDEEKWMVRPIRKKRGVTRYEQEYPNMPRGHFSLDDFEGEPDAHHCFAAVEDGEQAATYDEVMKSRYK